MGTHEHTLPENEAVPDTANASGDQAHNTPGDQAQPVGTPSLADGAAPGEEAAPGKGAQTRRAILDAAIARFGRDGYRATSVADIARDAGVGGTVTYAYFPNKEALFAAALDEDAAAVISEGVSSIFDDHRSGGWRQALIFTLVDAVDRHPLAQRVLAGLEPHVTARMLELPALTELRKAVADRLRSEQLDGLVRPDIDPVAIGSGAVAIFIALLMAIQQLGRDGVETYAPDVFALFAAAIDPVAE